jgi:hypothetical protein
MANHRVAAVETAPMQTTMPAGFACLVAAILIAETGTGYLTL